jgi:hypothetical protein
MGSRPERWESLPIARSSSKRKGTAMISTGLHHMQFATASQTNRLRRPGKRS